MPDIHIEDGCDYLVYQDNNDGTCTITANIGGEPRQALVQSSMGALFCEFAPVIESASDQVHSLADRMVEIPEDAFKAEDHTGYAD